MQHLSVDLALFEHEPISEQVGLKPRLGNPPKVKRPNKAVQVDMSTSHLGMEELVHLHRQGAI